MSPIIKKLIVVFGGMAVMVVTTVCGFWIGGQFRCCGGRMDYSALFYGGEIGAVVGGLLWGLLVYVCRDKKPVELPPGPPSS